MPVVYLGIGSNLGDRLVNCLGAVKRLGDRGVKVLKESSVIESEPWGVRDQPRFLNMAVEAQTELAAVELLDLLKSIEREMGRTESVRWGPRIIDIDILFYGDDVIDTETLKVPHPFVHERDFTLRPLSEIAPNLVHPVIGKTIKNILTSLS